MTNYEFDNLVDLVVNTGITPPRVLFNGGFEDWHARIALAKFLSHPAYQQFDAAIYLLQSITNITVNHTPLDIEYKAWALQQLAKLLRKTHRNLPEALTYINQAIALAESADYQYTSIVRGDLWAERWILLHFLKQTELALTEADQKIAKYRFTLAKNNSYLYNAYRFKAQVTAAKSELHEALSYMKKALSYIKLNEANKKDLAVAFSLKHHNIFKILSEIDLATPRIESIEWTV